MTGVSRKKILSRLLLEGGRKSRLWAALAALTIGTLLLLVSALIWWDFHELLYGNRQNDNLGSTYVIIGKQVTEQNAAVKDATVFEPAEITALHSAPQVQDVGIITSNQFPVYATLGGKLAFATDMVLESVPDNFIDKMPAEWHWQPGQRDLPIIVSSQFLNIYNYVFAPSQGLPQLSEAAVKAIALNFKVGSGDKSEMFMARVVGFSDRISSVLTPQSFIDYGNKAYGKTPAGVPPSQLILKTNDPSDTKFGDYLRGHNYNTSPQNLKWSRMRAIVETVTSATGLLAALLLAMGVLVFILFIELTIARAQQSLTLLLQIGYSPRYLAAFMNRRFVPMVFASALVSAILVVVVQGVAKNAIGVEGLALSVVPGWPVWLALAVSTVILVSLILVTIRRETK